MKTALVYDRVNKWGGAESVLLALNEIFPDAPLYTALYDSEKARWARVFPKIVTSFLQSIPCVRGRHEYLATLMPFAFESFNFDDFDLVISVTSEAAKGIITKPKTRHICYCLTPTRYLWSGYEEYFSNSILKTISSPVVAHLKKWDIIASKRPDKIIAISNEVKARIKKYYRLNSQVIYPPLRFRPFKELATSPKKEDYYLVVSRLVSYKKVDLVVKTFNRLGKKLLIVGTGVQRSKLKRMAKSNIEFLGKISEKELIEIYKKAKALIMPQKEDLGLVSLESQSMGTPVISFSEGGAKETIIEGKTGILFEKQTIESLSDAILRFENKRFYNLDLVNNSQKFAKEVFKKNFLSIIRNN